MMVNKLPKATPRGRRDEGRYQNKIRNVLFEVRRKNKKKEKRKKKNQKNKNNEKKSAFSSIRTSISIHISDFSFWNMITQVYFIPRSKCRHISHSLRLPGYGDGCCRFICPVQRGFPKRPFDSVLFETVFIVWRNMWVCGVAAQFVVFP